MMSEPLIESATLDDLPRLTDLLFDLFTQERDDFEPNRERQMRGLQLILEHPKRGRIFVLRHHGHVIGMINLLFTISTAEGGFVMLLEDLVVDPQHRGNGFGERLLIHAIDYAKQKSFLRIRLITDHHNHSSVNLFKRHGFAQSNMVTMRLQLPREDR